MRFVPMGLSRMQHSVFAGLHLRRTFRVRCSIIRLSNSDQFGCERRPKRLLLPGPILVGAFKERLHFMGDFLNQSGDPDRILVAVSLEVRKVSKYRRQRRLKDTHTGKTRDVVSVRMRWFGLQICSGFP